MERESQRDRCGGRQVQRQTAIQIDGETRRTGTQLFKDSLIHNGRQDQSHTGMEMDRGIPDTHTHTGREREGWTVGSDQWIGQCSRLYENQNRSISR